MIDAYFSFFIEKEHHAPVIVCYSTQHVFIDMEAVPVFMDGNLRRFILMELFCTGKVFFLPRIKNRHPHILEPLAYSHFCIPVIDADHYGFKDSASEFLIKLFRGKDLYSPVRINLTGQCLVKNSRYGVFVTPEEPEAFGRLFPIVAVSVKCYSFHFFLPPVSG